ncbi:uncharacterized protein [Palaemon carinicauda]|uniref:uncharacterized protein n=1 Tax=Palaemon carinicauda TaxID=392227 RepID=UPI0035B5F3A8
MGGTGDWDIESYRSFYESDEHWALKKEFMETHYDALPEERLVCLAQVYANIELLGCRYPEKVMEEVSYLARGVGMAYKERKKTKLQRTFVKASDAAGAKVRGPKGGQKRKNPNETAPHEPLYKKKVPFVQAESSSKKSLASKPLTFVKAESTAEERTSNPIMSFIKAVRDDNPSEEGEVMEAPTSDDKESMALDKCMSFIKSIRGSDSEQGFVKSTSPEQKNLADKYKRATQLSARQRITFPDDRGPNDNTIGRGIGRGNFRSSRGRTGPSGNSRDRGQYAAYLDALMRNNDPLSDFILVHRIYGTSDHNPTTILEQSANFSHMPLNCNFDQNETRCRITINGIHVATARGDNRRGAKEAASVKALEVLINRCFTLRILKLHSSSEEVSLSEVDTQNASSKFTSKHGSTIDTPIEDSSVGSKLLKMMGWAGGGLGKDGSGIAEPIKPQHVFGRTGLGHEGEQGVTKMFKNKIRAMLQDYLRGSDMNDLAFSPLFSKEQRAEIHKMARAMRLKSQSHGKGENRFLVISRKFSPKQLLIRLLQEGPTDKYELVAPGES